MPVRGNGTIRMTSEVIAQPAPLPHIAIAQAGPSGASGEGECAMDRRDALRSAAKPAIGVGSSASAEAQEGPRAGYPPGALAIVVSLRVKPEHEAEFLRLLAPVLDAMRHEATFINAALHHDPEDPTHFMLYETWADRHDLVEVQMKRPYRAAYEARLPELLREPREARIWQPLRSDFTGPAVR